MYRECSTLSISNYYLWIKTSKSNFISGCRIKIQSSVKWSSWKVLFHANFHFLKQKRFIFFTFIVFLNFFNFFVICTIRYLVASRDLEAGEEILTELPVVVGPKACSGPLCLSCYTPWPMTPENPPLCSTCNWPVCNQECEKLSQHKDYECPVKFLF